MATDSITRTQEEIDQRYDRCIESLEDASEEFLKLDGVVGVGYGPKEKGGQIMEDEPCIIVYVREKKDRNALSPQELIPNEFRGVPTDAVVPGCRSEAFYNNYDFRWLDGGKIHAQNPQWAVNLEPTVDYDLDDVAILEIDNTFLSGNNIDFVKAVKRFLSSHPDAFDFITFFVHTASSLPGQGSWHRGVYNKTKGINYYAGSNLDNQNTYGSTKLLAIHSISFFGNYVLLQETGHMWGAFVRNRDTQAGPNRYDLLISPNGQGKFHWGRFFDNDHSPMDYDGIDWVALGGNRFRSHGILDDFFHFCPLDLYLMGLTYPGQVGSFYVIQSPSGNSGTITGTRKNIVVQNVIWAEGARNPAYPNTQKVWKQAFVVLTKDARSARSFAQQVAQQRREFTWQFYKANRFLGKVDTTLRSYIRFPQIRDISVAEDNDRAIIGWKTNVSARGKVNYSTSPAAFRRDQAHTEPFSTVTDPTFSTSHGVLLTGLAPNRTYYFEIIAETRKGLFDRQGVEQFYTRKTNDTCKPDINNVSVRKVLTKVVVSWKTDEPSDSRVYYGTSIPPAQQKHDPYPTTDHSITLTGLSAGTYYIAVESRDAAGNVTRDDNSGNYYQVVIPVSAAVEFEAVSPKEFVQRTEAINAAVKMGDMANALEQTSELILHVAERELGQIVQTTTVPADDLEAGCAALSALVCRLGATAEIVERGDDFVDVSVDPDPLSTIVCVDLAAEMVAEECGYPVLSDIVSKVRPGLILEPHPTRGMRHYRLRRG